MPACSLLMYVGTERRVEFEDLAGNICGGYVCHQQAGCEVWVPVVPCVAKADLHHATTRMLFVADTRTCTTRKSFPCLDAILQLFRTDSKTRTGCGGRPTRASISQTSFLKTRSTVVCVVRFSPADTRLNHLARCVRVNV